MKRNGLEKARARLRDAFAAFERLQCSQGWEDFEAAWTQILTSLNSVYSILEQSSRGDARSEGWFSRIKGQRRADEILRYLQHARNANDHGISQVIKLEPGGISIGHGSHVEIRNLKIGSGVVSWEGGHEDGQPLTVVRHPNRVELIPVMDRGVQYNPPTSFLGEPLADESPIAVAHIVLEFMVSLFGEAEGLVAQQ